MPKLRSPVLGYNHNIRHKGWVFHVQTEDSGVQNPHLFTHLFHEGVIIASKKLEYDPNADEDIVKSLMQAQHKATMKELRHGIYGAKIDQYLGPAPPETESQAIPQVMAEEAAATIPNSPPIELEMEAEASTSAPYSQLVLEDPLQSVVSGTFDVKSAPIEQPPEAAAGIALLDGDDEINGLLSRLREETPPPEIIREEEADAGQSTSAVQSEPHPGAWIQARPGKKERPFDRSEPVPVPVRDEVARRVMTPPVLPAVDVPTPKLVTPPSPKVITPPPIPVGAPRRPSAPTPKVQPPPPPRTAGPSRPPTNPPVMPLSGARTSPPPVLPRSAHSGTAPVVPRAAAASSMSPPPPPRTSGPVQGRTITPPPVRAMPRSAGATPPPRTQPPPPVLPRSQPLAPLGARPNARAQTPPPVRGGSLPVAGGPRRSLTGESVVVARPAVVIGAPPTVIGGPADHSSRTRTPHHGREPSAAAQSGENIFGQDLISEKSLDEVIMAYLSEESTDE